VRKREASLRDRSGETAAWRSRPARAGGTVASVIIRIGTSGYGYKEWKGSFYPADLKDAKMLAYYATKLATVEINYTFRQMPTEALLTKWAGDVPDDFRFVLKAPERITHRARLKDAREPTEQLVRVSRVMGPKLGALLFQLPPHAKKDVAVLATFLQELRAMNAPPAAFEFRHPSWHEDDALACLREHGAALCMAETDESAVGGDDLEAPLVSTAPWSYLRLRRTNYTASELAAWAQRVRAQPWTHVYVFLKHEDEGKAGAFALKLREILAV
jgi:uncharacterized protein YecE (DUF72 family)